MADISLSQEQERAVLACSDVDSRLICVTGAAGTGKTTILKLAYEELVTVGHSVVLCAPTGRAAKRITEATGIEASTIHKLLRFPMPGETIGEDGKTKLIPGKPYHCNARPFEYDVVFVDEASMISYYLWRQLMEALKPGASIRFFGDNNQLPPVEVSKDAPPPFLKAITTFETIWLTYNYRSGDEIIINSNLILGGQVPQRNSRFEIVYTNNPIRYAIDFIPEEFREWSHQVLCPTRKGKYGTNRLNPSLQMKFNKSPDVLYLERFDEDVQNLGVRAGDKFIWTKNDYALDIFNGELGTITDIDTHSGDIDIQTPDKELLVPARVTTYNAHYDTTITYDPRKQIDLGYAITVHKAQGSEFDTVIYVMTSGASFLLNRNNFYTGITRAKENVIVICDSKAMRYALRQPKRV